MDSDGILRPFNEGWRREVVYRNKKIKDHKQLDIYYYSPDGTKHRSMKQIIETLKRNPGNKLESENFVFSNKIIYKEPFEIVRCAASNNKSIDGAQKRRIVFDNESSSSSLSELNTDDYNKDHATDNRNNSNLFENQLFSNYNEFSNSLIKKNSLSSSMDLIRNYASENILSNNGINNINNCISFNNNLLNNIETSCNKSIRINDQVIDFNNVMQNNYTSIRNNNDNIYFKNDSHSNVSFNLPINSTSYLFNETMNKCYTSSYDKFANNLNDSKIFSKPHDMTNQEAKLINNNIMETFSMEKINSLIKLNDTVHNYINPDLNLKLFTSNENSIHNYQTKELNKSYSIIFQNELYQNSSFMYDKNIPKDINQIMSDQIIINSAKFADNEKNRIKAENILTSHISINDNLIPPLLLITSKISDQDCSHTISNSLININSVISNCNKLNLQYNNNSKFHIKDDDYNNPSKEKDLVVNNNGTYFNIKDELKTENKNINERNKISCPLLYNNSIKHDDEQNYAIMKNKNIPIHSNENLKSSYNSNKNETNILQFDNYITQNNTNIYKINSTKSSIYLNSINNILANPQAFNYEMANKIPLQLPSTESPLIESKHVKLDSSTANVMKMEMIIKFFYVNFKKPFVQFESVLNIFSFLPVIDLLSCAQVCQSWRLTAIQPKLWKSVNLKTCLVKDWSKAVEFFKLRGTQSLDLGFCSGLAFHTFVIHAKNLKELEYIKLCLVEENNDARKQLPLELNLEGLSSLVKLKSLNVTSIGGIHRINSIDNIIGLNNLIYLSLKTLHQQPEDNLIFISCLKNLRFLELGDCFRWNKKIYEEIGNCKQLVCLKLHSSIEGCHDFFIPCLQNLNKLRQLELINFRLTSQFIANLPILIQLRTLVICPQLSTIWIQDATLHGELFKCLCKMTFLDLLNWKIYNIIDANKSLNLAEILKPFKVSIILTDNNQQDVSEMEIDELSIGLSIWLKNTKLIIDRVYYFKL